MVSLLELEQALKKLLDLEIYIVFIKLLYQIERKTKKTWKRKRRIERMMKEKHRYRYKSVCCNSGVIFY